MKNFKNKNFIYRLILSAVFLVSNFFDNEAELINAVQLTSINFCAMPLQTKELPQEKLLFQCQRQQQIYYSISPNIMEDMTKL